MTRAKTKQLRQLIEQLAVTLNDETALTGVELFPMWTIGRAYAVDDRVQYGGILYRMFARLMGMYMRRMCTDGHSSRNTLSLRRII